MTDTNEGEMSIRFENHVFWIEQRCQPVVRMKCTKSLGNLTENPKGMMEIELLSLFENCTKSASGKLGRDDEVRCYVQMSIEHREQMRVCDLLADQPFTAQQG